MITKEEILKQGYVDVKVYVSGLRQAHRLTLVKENTPNGWVPYLVSKYYIPTQELLKLAEEFQLPVKHKDISVFPRGKMASSFAEKDSSNVVMTESDTVEAEVEE
ncbi:hypothetical protein HZC07_03080 [Candidatus Micrarchaeota archaeon]|nr:hypothetical protein [Candidatus Micrarchaeota archaeon]